MSSALSLPTPVFECPSLSSARVRLWVKNDGLTHPVYGGNKVRKVVRLLDAAEERGAKRILTLGAAGSHHVLTTAWFARERGLRAAAVLTPQPVTPHVEAVLRGALGCGLEAYPAVPAALVPLALARAYEVGDYLVPPGGSNVRGALAYVDAVGELAAQVRAGELPEPNVIVVGCGSGGTSAGILAGLVRHGLKARLLAVLVLSNPFARLQLRALAHFALRSLGVPPSRRELDRRFAVDASEVGAGYGHATADGTVATETAAREIGLELDPTYTAKSFSATLKVLENANAGAPKEVRHILYWHTLSAVPIPGGLEWTQVDERARRALAALAAPGI